MTLDATNGNITSTTGTLTLTSVDGVTINDSLTTNGDLTISGTSNVSLLTVATGADVSTTNNDIVITIHDIDLDGTLSSGADNITITQTIANADTSIGDFSTNVDLQIDATELERITANELTINSTEAITVSNITGTNSDNIGTVRLNALVSDVRFFDANSTFNTLVVTADDDIDFFASVTTDTGAISLNAQGTGANDGLINTNGDIVIDAATSLTIQNENGINGTAGTLTLNADTGITITGGNITTVGQTTINSDTTADGNGDLDIGAEIDFSTSGNGLNITANDLILGTNSTITVTNADLVINESHGGGIGFGNATLGGLNISLSEFSRITSGNLDLNTNGDIATDSIDEDPNPRITNVTTLDAGGNISFITTNTFNNLIAEADDGIFIFEALTGANLSLDGDADNAADTNDAITITGNQTLLSGNTGAFVGTTGSLTLAATTGNITTDGNLDLTISQDTATMTINDSLAANGEIVINTLLSSGNLVVADGAIVSTANRTININVGDIDLSNTGALNAGTDNIEIFHSNSAGIGLGDTQIAGGMNISAGELTRMTASILDLDASNITIDNILGSNSDNIGTVVLDISRDGNSTITFQGSNSTFNALDARAEGGIAINVDVAADTGSIILNADDDNAADGNNNDRLQFATGVTVSANTTLTLTATTGDINGDGTLTLNANSGIAVNDNLTTSNLTTINSDVDGDGNADANGFGDLNLAANITLTTTNGDLTITTNDLVTSNVTINAGTGDILITDSDGTGLEFGAAAGGNNLNISDVELGLMTASNLTISTNGDAVVENISAANSDNIAVTTALNANGDITFQNGDSTFNELLAQGNTGIIATVNITTDTGRLTLDTTEANSDITIVNLTSTGDMNVDPIRNLTINGTTLTASSNGDILIGEDTAGTNGNITANNALDIQSAGNVTIRNSGTVTVANGDLTINNSITGSIDAGAPALINVTNADSVLTFSGTGDITGTDITTNSGDITLTPGDGQDIIFADPDGDGVTINAQSNANITIGENGAGNGDVTSNAALDIRNAVDVTFRSSGNITVNNGAFSINTGITGDIDTSTIANGISVTQANADLSFIAGDNISLASVTTNVGDITATPGAGDTLTITGGILNSTGGNVSLGENGAVGDGVITATAAGLNILNPNNVLLANSGNIDVDVADFLISNGTGDIDASTVNAITVGSNLSLNWASNTVNGNVDYGAAVISAGNITINLSGSNSTVEETTGTLAVTQEGGDVSITTGGAHTFGSGTSEIALAGTLGFIDLTATSSNSTVTIEDTALTGGSALNSLNVTGNTGVNVSVDLEADANGSTILITATTGEIAGGNQSITANNGTLTLNAAQAAATSNVTIGNLTGIGVSVNAGGNADGTITLSSTVNALDNNVDMTARLLNATTNGLDVLNSNNVTFDIGTTMTISGGDFTIDNDVTGRIDVGANASIDVQGTNNLSFVTSSADGIDYGVATINAGNITLTLSNAAATIQESTGTLAVNATGGDVNISVQGSQTFGENGDEIAFGGTTTFIDLTVNTGVNVDFEDTALTGANALNTITANAQDDVNSSVNLQTVGSLSLTAADNVDAAGQNLTAAGTLAVTAGDDAQVNDLDGRGVTVQAADNFTVNSITAGGQDVNVASQDMLASAADLTISNADDVTLAVTDNITVNNGNLAINTSITGDIDASTADTIGVAAGNVTIQTTGNSINYGGADVTGNSIAITAANGAITQNANGSLAVNADGGDVTLSQNANLSIGDTAGTIRLGGTTADIDLDATSSGTTTLASSLDLNTADVTGASVEVDGAQTTDTGAVNVQATSGDITGENTSITSNTDLTMQASSGISADGTALTATNGDVNLTASTGVVTGNVNAVNGNITIIANQANTNGAFTRAIASGGNAIMDDITGQIITVIANSLTTGSISGTTITLTASSDGTLSLGSSLASSAGSILLDGASVSGSDLSFTSADDLNFNSISSLTNTGDLTFNVTDDILATFLNLSTTGTSSLTAQTIANLGTTTGNQGLTFNVNTTTGFQRTGETVFDADTGQLTLVGFYNVIGSLFVNGATFDFTRATFGAQTELKFIPAQEIEGEGVQTTTVTPDTVDPTDIFFEVEPDITDFEIEVTPIEITSEPPTQGILEILTEVLQIEVEVDEDAIQLDFFPPILVGESIVDNASEVSIGSSIEQLMDNMRTLMSALNNVQRLTTLADQIQENPDQFNALMISDPWIRDARQFITLAPIFLLKAGQSTSHTRATLMRLIEPLRDTHVRAYKLLSDMIEEETEDAEEEEE
ncbi:MAG: S-layer family protein [Planctomycetota bacterium]|nr:S-layer family protein [Planctomycetota bacterium]